MISYQMSRTGETRHDPAAMHAVRFDGVAWILLIGLVIAAFAPALSNGLVWDDLPNLVYNRTYLGWSSSSLWWMFTTAHGGHYQPLSWVSYALDATVWGADSGFGFHLTNLALHALNAVLVYALAVRLVERGPAERGAMWTRAAAIATALAFAVHPLRVESVAWATERRDVLSTLFLLVTLLCYIAGTSRERRRSRRTWLVMSWLAYACSLLSKATGMTLPVVLLILDIYPLRRVGRPGRTSWRNVLIEKLAFALPALTVALLAVWAQSKAGALWTFGDHPLTLRIAQACYGLMFYPLATLWPANLIPLYEQRPEAAPWDAANLLGAAFFVAVTIIAWQVRRRHPAVLAGWSSYVVLVAPMLGLAQSGPQVVADRYSYVSCIPLVLLFGAFIGSIWRVRGAQASRARWITVAVSAPLCVTLVLTTRAQTRIWNNPLTLWTTTLARAPDTPTAHANLAVLYYNRGQYGLARDHSLAALEHLPGNRSAHRTLGFASAKLGAWATAEQSYRRLIHIAEHLGETDRAALRGLAEALVEQQRYAEAESLYRRQIEKDPSEATWHVGLAALYTRRGRLDAADSELRTAIEADPGYVEAYLRLSELHERAGRTRTALERVQTGLNEVKEDLRLLTRLAWLLATSPDDALRDGQRALNLASTAVHRSGGTYPRAIEALAAAQAALGRHEEAVATLAPLRDNPPPSFQVEDRRRIAAAITAYTAGRRPGK